MIATTVLTIMISVCILPFHGGLAITEYNQCFNTTGCFGVQFKHDSCDCVSERKCDMIVTYKNNSNGDVAFSILGNVSSNQYLAVGISNDNKMGDDSVVMCYHSGSTSGVAMSWNKGRSGSFPLVNPHFGLINNTVRSSYENGILSCSFTRLHITNIPTGRMTKLFNLSLEYYLLLAYGDVTNSQEFEEHDGKKSSSQYIKFNKLENIKCDETGKTIIRAHGSMMVIAWMLFACVGTFTARYMFHGFPENAGFYWFEIHQVCMSLTWILSISSVLVQFVMLGPAPILSQERYGKNPHTIIGLVAVMLMFIQPFMGFLRPTPISRKRETFNRIHHFVGTAATLLSLIAIVTATYLERLGLPNEAQMVSVGFLAYYVFCHIIMTFASHHNFPILEKSVPFRYAIAIAGMLAFICGMLYILLNDLHLEKI